jgi:hypothetical protein
MARRVSVDLAGDATGGYLSGHLQREHVEGALRRSSPTPAFPRKPVATAATAGPLAYIASGSDRFPTDSPIHGWPLLQSRHG